jgi:SAM-dependent methyltransferase
MGAKQAVRLNVGCGRHVLEGWLNLDRHAGPGVDVVADLESLRERPLPLAEGSVDEFLVSHVIEHVRDSLGLMEELWRVAKPGALAVIRVPYGSSDDAWEDPTHLRPYFVGSFGFLAQPWYWRADYGYRGDWQPERITLLVDRAHVVDFDAQRFFRRIQSERNLVREMVAELRAVKPARAPKRELMTPPAVTIVPVDPPAP